MMQFIYCFDDNTKLELINKGYKLIQEAMVANQTSWIFEFKPEFNYDIKNKNTCFVSNIMRF